MAAMLAIYFVYKSAWFFLPSLKSIGLSIQEKKQKNRFSKCPTWATLDFWMEQF